MTSPRRSQGRPVESVTLKVAFRADEKTSKKIRELFPSVRVRNGSAVLVIEGEGPREVAEKAKEALEKIRALG